MNHHSLRFALLLLACGPLAATEFFFANFDTTLHQEDGTPWGESLEVRLGGFDSGFTPTAGNTSLWASEWVGGTTGYYETFGSDPEWLAALTLTDNVLFPVGSQLYVWVFDSLLSPTAEWALFTDASWLVAPSSLLDPNTYSFEFTADTQAIFGSLDFHGGQAWTAALPRTSVPDHFSVLGLLLLSLPILFGARRCTAS